MKGMQILVQAQVPISRPDDFFAEMLKSDDHMLKVKGNLLKQQKKMQMFEDKKSKQENKKFHKAIKSFTQEKRHAEKRQNLDAINTLKDKIKASGGDLDEKEFSKIMTNVGSKSGVDTVKGERSEKRVSMIDQIKNKEQRKDKTQVDVPFGKSGKGE